MAAGKRVHKTRIALADLMIPAPIVLRKALPDNRPSPDMLAALARATVSAKDVDAVNDILTACEKAWTKEEIARFWQLLKDWRL